MLTTPRELAPSINPVRMRRQRFLKTVEAVVDEMEVYESSIAAEVQRQLPFLATTTLLMAAVKAGGGRERMHEVIRGHSVAVARGLREGSLTENDLAARLEADPDFPLGRDSIQDILSDPSRFLGAAPTQVDAFLGRELSGGVCSFFSLVASCEGLGRPVRVDCGACARQDEPRRGNLAAGPFF